MSAIRRGLMSKEVFYIDGESGYGYGVQDIAGLMNGRDTIFPVGLQQGDHDTFLHGADDPVFPDAGFLVDIEFIACIVLGIAGGEDLYDEIGGAAYPAVVDLLRIADHADIGLDNGGDLVVLFAVLHREADVEGCDKGFTGTSFEVAI